LLRIRLTRVGKKKQPAYRIVVADSRSPRDGAHLKIIGHYNPRTEPVTLVVKEDEAVHWLNKGARPSETAAKLLTRIGVMERAGRAPVRYVGKDAPAAEKAKKDEKAAAPAPAQAPAAVAEAEEPSADAATPAEEPAEPDATREPAATARTETESVIEPETEDQPQEPAEPQE